MLGSLQDLRLTHTHVADGCNFGQGIRGAEDWDVLRLGADACTDLPRDTR